MSYIDNNKGRTYIPGYFLADAENCVRETHQFEQSKSTDVNGAKVIYMGTVYPSNDANALGIVYEDVDVTCGDMPGSLVTRGVVYKDRLPETIASAAITALQSKGFKFIDSKPAVVRPY